MINVGIAGIGFMGMIHYLAYQRIRGAKLVAVCEQDSKKLAGDWRSIKGNFGPSGELVDLSGMAKYSHLEDLVADVTTGHKVLSTVFIQCGSAYRKDGPEEMRPVGETETVVPTAEVPADHGAQLL